MLLEDGSGSCAADQTSLMPIPDCPSLFGPSLAATLQQHLSCCHPAGKPLATPATLLDAQDIGSVEVFMATAATAAQVRQSHESWNLRLV